MKKFFCDQICMLLALALLMICGAAIEGTMSLWVVLPYGVLICAAASFFYQLGRSTHHRKAAAHRIAANRRVHVVPHTENSLRAA